MSAEQQRESTTDLTSTRDLTRFVQIFENALEARLCAQMVESFEKLAHAHTRNGRGVTGQLKQSGWTELNISKVADAPTQNFFRNQVFEYLDRYNKQVGLTLPIPPRERIENLRIKRYLAAGEDQFQPHFDSIDYTSNRYLVFLWYLNDVPEGGETEFPDLGLRVAARAGRLLMFPPYWMFQHAGLPSKSGDKYILSTYLLF